jgi:deoxyadenosine/deoxycytidine kinase
MRISIEGNIASSKSSLLQLLHEKGGYAVYPEPVHEWGEWLQLFYQDTKRWAFGFQMKVLSSFVREYDEHSIVERSMLSVRHVFGQLLFNQNLLAQKEWDLFRSVADMFTWEPDVIIYIACPPEVCLQRMHARARPAEAHVTLEYLHKIDFMYTRMLKYFSGRVIQVDGSRPLADVYSDVAAAVLQLRGEQQACGGHNSSCSSSCSATQ